MHENSTRIIAVIGRRFMMPALVAGVAASATTTLAVKQRGLTDQEFAFVNRVYRDTLPRHRILLTNLISLKGHAFTTPGPGDSILLHLGAGYDDPTTYVGHGGRLTDRQPGQLLIHELVHAWQIIYSCFAPTLFCGALNQRFAFLGDEISVPKYGPAGPRWSFFNLEQQAGIVEDWFSGTGEQADYGEMNESDANPYWRYLRDHVRARVA